MPQPGVQITLKHFYVLDWICQLDSEDD
uniref:Uncharacterized protein n=1 Tax=Rhizophora mucronata TaxID=61149 RepID=A0A2P2P354_RHIMU